MKLVTQPRLKRGHGLAAAIAMIALAIFAPAATAASNPLAGGATTIQLDPGFLKKSAKRGVKMLGLSPASVGGGVVALPVSEGTLDPLSGGGIISHAGEIKFKHGKRTARVGGLVLDTSSGALNGVVVGQPVTFARFHALSITRNGFGVDLSIAELALTGKAAKLLNEKLGFAGKPKKRGKRKGLRKPFEGKQVLGMASSATQPRTVTILPSGKAKLVPDLETAGKLFAAGATGEPVPPAEFEFGPPPAVSFPIAGGVFAPNGSAGVLQTLGGEKLSKGPAVTIATNIWIDLGLKLTTAEVEVTGFPEAPGKLGRVPHALVDLSAATIASDPAARTIAVGNAVLRMSASGAASLNATYGTEFKEGDPIGTLGFTAQAE
jgi:hypothetical protein